MRMELAQKCRFAKKRECHPMCLHRGGLRVFACRLAGDDHVQDFTGQACPHGHCYALGGVTSGGGSPFALSEGGPSFRDTRHDDDTPSGGRAIKISSVILKENAPNPSMVFIKS
jgi:hypothetical protein